MTYKGNYFVTSDWDGTLWIYDLRRGLEYYLEYPAPVFGNLFSSDSSLLLAESINGTIYVVETQTGKELARLRHADFLIDTYITKKNTIVSISNDSTLRVWDLENFQHPKVINNSGEVQTINFHPRNDNQFVIGTSLGVVQLWDIKRNKAELTYSHSDSIRDIRFSPSGEFIASISEDGYLYFASTSQYNFPNPKITAKR